MAHNEYKQRKSATPEVTATVLPERSLSAGCQTSQRDAVPQSVSQLGLSSPSLLSGRQPREPCDSGSATIGASTESSRARTDFARFVEEEVNYEIPDEELIFEHWVERKGKDVLCCYDRNHVVEQAWQRQWGQYPRLYCTQKSKPAPPPITLPYRCSQYRNFPYKGAHTFRKTCFQRS